MEVLLPSKLKIISEDKFKGVYEIEGFYPGYGHTIGNSLRRILLSSLEGAAPTRVKISGVNHEFSIIPGVKEDVINIILNIKNLRLKMHGDEPQTLVLKEKGEKEIKAGDFKTPSQVEIMNKEITIATLTNKKSLLDMEVKVEKGIGYITKEELSKEKVEIGAIHLDALFSPVRRVSYEVENMRVGERTDFNRLRLTIETDGSILPRESLNRAIEIMLKQLSAIADFKEAKAEKGAEEETKPAKESENKEKDVLAKPISEFNFAPRIKKALEGDGIITVGQLIKRKEADILELKGIGEEALQEIKKSLVKLDLGLKE